MILFVLKGAIVLSFIIIPVLFTLALEKRQREQRERDNER